MPDKRIESGNDNQDQGDPNQEKQIAKEGDQPQLTIEFLGPVESLKTVSIPDPRVDLSMTSNQSISSVSDLFGQIAERFPKAQEAPHWPIKLLTKNHTKQQELEEDRLAVLQNIAKIFANSFKELQLQIGEENVPLVNDQLLTAPRTISPFIDSRELQDATQVLMDLVSNTDPDFGKAVLDTRIGLLTLLHNVIGIAIGENDAKAALAYLRFLAAPYDFGDAEPFPLEDIPWQKQREGTSNEEYQGPFRKDILGDRYKKVTETIKMPA